MKRSGFTLTELIISIGLALLLMVGIQRVFTSASNVIGAGQATIAANRNGHNAYLVLRDDLQHTAHDAPFFAIANNLTNSYETRDDLDNATPADRRTDKVIMFVRGKYARQTGNGGELITDGQEGEAYIWVGHLAVGGQAPGAGNATSNPNNFFANSWMLGRMVIGMNPAVDGVIYIDPEEPPFVNFRHDPDYAPGFNLTPFIGNARSSDGNWLLRQSRYDMAGITIADYRWIIEHAAVEAAASAITDWWRPLVNFRFETVTAVSRPLDPDAVARMTPQFLHGVTEFVVEFAGDWVTQNQTTGAIVAHEPDGVLDFRLSGPDKTTQWFGLPRDIDGDGTNDVLPMYTFAGNNAAPFERNLTATEYVCLWGGDDGDARPKYIRYIITQTDHRGRLPNPISISVLERMN